MGQTCSYVSDDLVSNVNGTIPTFAANPGNGAYLSAYGSFMDVDLNGATCALPTKYGDQVATITPFLIGPDASTTYCLSGVITPSPTDDNNNFVTTYTPFSCPEATLNALPTGRYTLGFEQNAYTLDNPWRFYGPSIAMNTFVWTTPLPTATITEVVDTTTLDPVPASTETDTITPSTFTTTETPPATPSSTTTTTEYTSTTIVVVLTTLQPTSTVTGTVYTSTYTSTIVVAGKPTSTQTFTSYSQTITSTDTLTLTTSKPPSTTTKSVSSCPPTACSKGTAPTSLACPVSDGKCYTASNGDTYIIECGQDRLLGDLAILTRPNFKSCVDGCSSTSGCVGVSYLAPVLPALNGLCTLKRTSFIALPNPLITGARLVRKGSSQLKRLAVRQEATGAHPDYTYPPLPETTTSVISTVTPEPSGTTTTTVSATATVTETAASPASGIATRTFSTDTKITTTTSVTPADPATVTKTTDTTVSTTSTSIPSTPATTTVFTTTSTRITVTSTLTQQSSPVTTTVTGCFTTSAK